MNHPQIHPFLPGAIDELQKTTGVARGYDFRPGGPDMFEFATEELIGHLRLHNIVNAGAAAAPRALGQFDQFQIRDRAQELARLGGDFLAVAKMTGFVLSDHHLLAWRAV